jgi:flagellar basal-body rod modification protein FlgD
MESVASTQNNATGAAAAPSRTAQAREKQNQFLQLLVAQLKGQNPLNPMEGSEFVGQLAQFSSLEELTHISGTLESVQALLEQQNAPADMGGATPLSKENTNGSE